MFYVTQALLLGNGVFIGWTKLNDMDHIYGMHCGASHTHLLKFS